ncbi:MAG: hypothetical protein GX769_02155 [Erysipelothrix sp.]|nr:hypothetical protein [Erysipelothrix sp.]
MKFNYHAVGKKARIKKTLLFGIPLSIVVAVVGSFVINLAKSMGFNIFYYGAVLGIGYVIGVAVKKIGRGTTNEFLYIAGILAFFSISLALFLSYRFAGWPITITSFIFNDLLALPTIQNDFTLIVVSFGVAVAVFQANTVQIR